MRPLRIAIIGSGPAAFYATEVLLRQKDLPVQVDMFERLPTPFGLVRAGVAPDHQSVKGVSRVFERTASRPGYRFFGNVSFGDQLGLAEIAEHYDQILYAVGSAADRTLGIAGENLRRCVPSTAFVGWYNGHPSFRHLAVDPSVRRVVVVGNGNVAVDVARILARTAAELASTDIADHALAVLERSCVEEIVLVGRRGPVQAAFSPAELRELGRLADADLVVDPNELVLDEHSQRQLCSAEPGVQRNVELLREFAQRGEGTHRRKIRLRFFASPVEIRGDASGAVCGVELEHNRLELAEQGRLVARGTGQRELIEAQMVVPAIGLRAVALPEVPFDEQRAIIPNTGGRVCRPDVDQGKALPLREYVVGWARTGPRGLIGSHKAGSEEVARLMIEDAQRDDAAARELPDAGQIEQLLADRGVSFVDFGQWRQLDAEEVRRGRPRGAPRNKVVDPAEMLSLMRKQP